MGVWLRQLLYYILYYLLYKCHRIQGKRKIKGNTRHTNWERRETSLFVDDMIFYTENPKKFTKNY